MSVKLHNIEKVYWHPDGFIIMIGVMIYIVNKGEFESGSMADIYQIFGEIPTIEIIKY